jgi:hypothetical protein
MQSDIENARFRVGAHSRNTLSKEMCVGGNLADAIWNRRLT